MTETRILVVVDPEAGHEVGRTFTLVRALARDSGAAVRLVAVLPIPKPVVDSSGRVLIPADVQLDRIDASVRDRLVRMAARHLDGIEVEVSAIFGDADVEIRNEAEAFRADLVVLTAAPRPSMASALMRVARPLVTFQTDLVDLRAAVPVAVRARDGWR